MTTTKTLMAINGVLVAGLMVAALTYLLPTRQERSGAAAPTGAPTAITASPVPAAARSRDEAIPAVGEGTDRFFTGAQMERLRTPKAPLEAFENPGEESVLVTIPVAFMEPEPGLVLGAEQLQAIQAVRQSFSKVMRRAGDPSSPEYLLQWLVEQERADRLLRAYLGPEDFNKLTQSLEGRAARQSEGGAPR